MKPKYLDAGISDNRTLYIKQIRTHYLDKPFHFHPNCELVFIEEGFGKRIIGDNVSNFNSGDVVLMGPNLPHIWMNDALFYKGDTSMKSIATVIYFSPFILDSLLDSQSNNSFKQLIEQSKRGITLKGKSRELIQQKLQLLIHQSGLTQLVNFLSILEIILRTTERKYLSGENFPMIYTERETSRINKVYQFLMQNFSHDILLNDVAAIAHMAPTAFCRYFKEQTGKTLSRFLNELRIQHACNLLLDPDKSISEICYESGYNNLTNFNKFFKEITRQTPSAYRATLNK